MFDPIPTKLLYETHEGLLPTITNIRNESFTSGTVHSELKTAVIKPLLKKPPLDSNDFKNYRLISNLPFLSKRLEKLALQQLASHLSTHNLLSIHQSAYRSGHSTETVLPCILSDLLDDNYFSCFLIFLQLFILWNSFLSLQTRLWHSWYSPGLVSIFFFSDGKQYVLIDDQKSTEMSLEFGVPHGSVLGPVLFILYTTPFTCLIEKHSLRHEMFADDTQLNHSESPENYSDLVRSFQDCVKNTGLCMKENKLQLNNGKTEAIRLSSSSFINTTLPKTDNLSQQYRCWVF